MDLWWNYHDLCTDYFRRMLDLCSSAGPLAAFVISWCHACGGLNQPGAAATLVERSDPNAVHLTMCRFEPSVGGDGGGPSNLFLLHTGWPLRCELVVAKLCFACRVATPNI